MNPKPNVNEFIHLLFNLWYQLGTKTWLRLFFLGEMPFLIAKLLIVTLGSKPSIFLQLHAKTSLNSESKLEYSFSSSGVSMVWGVDILQSKVQLFQVVHYSLPPSSKVFGATTGYTLATKLSVSRIVMWL